jgi:hypothetical protein
LRINRCVVHRAEKPEFVWWPLPMPPLFCTLSAGARREIFEYIEIYHNDRRLHSALGYQTPSQYETEFSRVIDIGISSPQSIDVASEDRALQGCNSSADATLQTAGAAAAGRPTAQGRSLPEQAQSEKSQGVRGTESPDSFDHTLKKTENYVSVCLGIFLTLFAQQADDIE